MPEGRRISNSTGGLGAGWGEVRGWNGIIVVEPSEHPDGGRYQWKRTDPIPMLPDYLAELLRDAPETGGETATPAEVRAFYAQHNRGNRDGARNAVIEKFRTVVSAGASRHQTMTSHLCWAMREAGAGWYPAEDAVAELRKAFQGSLRTANGHKPRGFDRGEFSRLVAYAVGQATDEEIATVMEKDEKGPDKEVTPDSPDVRKQLYELQVRELANELKEAAKARGARIELPNLSLDEMLALPRPEVPLRIEGMHRIGHNSTLAGGMGTGKTTVLANLVRSLADGVPFLDRFGVTQPEGRIAIVNYELSEEDMLDWLESLGIKNQRKVVPLNLRGVRFPLSDPYVKAQLTERLRRNDIEELAMDPHRMAMQGFGSENDNDHVNRSTATLDQIKKDAGVQDLYLPAHTGRKTHEEGEEHARGATALDDWADNRWVIVQKCGGRFFSVPKARVRDKPTEFKLEFDRGYLRLSAGVGNRRDAVVDRFINDVLRVVAEDDGIVKRDILKCFSKDKVAIGKAIDRAVEQDLMHWTLGERNAHHHHLGPAPEADFIDLEQV